MLYSEENLVLKMNKIISELTTYLIQRAREEGLIEDDMEIIHQ